MKFIQEVSIVFFIIIQLIVSNSLVVNMIELSWFKRRSVFRIVSFHVRHGIFRNRMKLVEGIKVYNNSKCFTINEKYHVYPALKQSKSLHEKNIQSAYLYRSV